MSKHDEIIKINDNNTLRFGNFEAIDKQKVADFDYNGRKLAVKTHKDITVLKADDSLVMETVPGSVVDNFNWTEEKVAFDIIGYKQTMITLGVAPDAEFKVYIDGVETETLRSKASGKISISVDIENVNRALVVEKI